MRQRKNSFGVSSLLSVVIPAFNQQKTIVRDVKNIEKTLQTLGYNYEIIIVNDGSYDDTLKRIIKLKSSRIKVLSYENNQGKGHAIRYGMMRANGDIIGFIDAGMDINPNGFEMLLNHMEWYNADIIVGSKLHPVSKVNYPFVRKILSWGYRWLTRIMFGFKIRDTQVGMKFFKRNVVREVLPRLLVKKYAFDIEMLAVSYQLGYKRIFEAPVEINFKNSTITTLNIWRTIFNMLWDTFAVFYRLKILNYYANSNKDNWKIAPFIKEKTPLTVERL
jgi:glycosyltransferase involved in cell wall biosynthesis